MRWSQAEGYKIDKTVGQSTNLTVIMPQMSYAEKYSCRAQVEEQTAHWNQSVYTSKSVGLGIKFVHM